MKHLIELKAKMKPSNEEYILWTLHLLSKYKLTRIVLNWAVQIVVIPIRKVALLVEILKWRASTTFHSPHSTSNKTIKLLEKDHEENKNICLFCHYDEFGEINDCTISLLEEIRNSGFDIAFCTTSPVIAPALNERIDHLCFLAIQRENVGLDFGSWKTLIDIVDVNYDSLLFVNDSILGPLHPLTGTLREFLNGPYEVLGLTDSIQIKHHIQSYFFCVKKSILKSKIWGHFWGENFKFYLDKVDTIWRQEIHLGNILIENFNCQILYRYSELVAISPNRNRFPFVSPLNPTVFYWDVLIGAFQFPFIKKEALDKFKGGRQNWERKNIRELKRQFT